MPSLSTSSDFFFFALPSWMWPEENAEEDFKTLSFDIPLLSEYATCLDKRVKRRCLEKISSRRS